MTQDVQQALPAEEDGEHHPERPDDQDVEGNGDVGRERADGGDEHRSGS